MLIHFLSAYDAIMLHLIELDTGRMLIEVLPVLIDGGLC